MRAVENAAAAGIVVVASAGNFGGDPVTHVPGYAGITSPGNAPNALTIGAIDTNDSNSRGDDVVAWYSSRGPTWYDGFQKPDLVAPGSKLVSNASTTSTLYKTYPGGVVTTFDKPFLRLSGTSMSAGVVSGVVALMIEANRTNYPGAPLTPNAVKAILQYTAFKMPNYDTLTQGAGSLNASGAVTLAAAIDARPAARFVVARQWRDALDDHRRPDAGVGPGRHLGRRRASGAIRSSGTPRRGAMG